MRRPTSTARTAHGHGANPGRRRGGSAGSGLPASNARGSRRSVVIGALHISALLHSNVSSISIDGRIAAACSSIDCRFAAACLSISIDGRIAAAACASIDCRFAAACLSISIDGRIAATAFAAACRIISSPVMMRSLVAQGRQDRQAPSIAHTGTVRKPGGIHVPGNHLESLVAEWCEFCGYFIRRNVQVGKQPKGGYEGELGVWGAMERKVRLATAVSGVSERPELAPSDRFRYGERVASQQVDVLVAER